MGIKTFSAQEKYRGGETEQRKKLKKVRSVKVANLDRLRMSMRRDKFRFKRGVVASSDDATEASESSSAAISGTSSPNYMKATTSSSARKGSSGSVSSSTTRTSATKDSSASSAKSTSKFSKVIVQDYSDPAGVDIPVKVKPAQSLKKVPSLKHSKKLSSKKSMRVRARYSQFPDVGINEGEMLGFGIMGFQDNAEINGGGMEFDPESLNDNASQSQDSMIEAETRQKGILERSRSRKLTRLRSSRSRQRPKSRFSGDAAEMMSHEVQVSNAEPRYMKGTSSHEARKNSDKGLARTSSLRPLRILAKIPSLRPKRNKVKKRPQGTSMSGTDVSRATCSSTLKRTKFPDDTELHLRNQQSEGASSFHVCPYSYCSIHGHRQHTPSQPVKEFITAKRKLLSHEKQQDSQSREVVEHYIRATETDHSREIISPETYEAQEVMHDTEVDDDGIDFLIKIYAKPRKKWVTTEGTLSNNAEALKGLTYDEINVEECEGNSAETLSETSALEEKQEELNADQQENLRIHKVDMGDKAEQHNSHIAALGSPLELLDKGSEAVSIEKELQLSIVEKEHQKHSEDPLHLASRDSVASLGGYLTSILSDKHKYTTMWQLIYQELVSSESSINEAHGVIEADEKGGDEKTSHEMSYLDVESSRNNNHLNEDVEGDVATTEKLKHDQTAAIKLVQGALNAILQHDADSHQQSNPVQEMGSSFVTECILSSTASSEENSRGSEIDGKGTSLESEGMQNEMKQTVNRLLTKGPTEREISVQQMSKSLSKLKKIFVTAKFIKAMEKLRKINPRTLQHLAVEPTSENERVYLRHLSMNDTRNSEEWMLDYALRQAIFRLDPDQQRRVAQLIEAFERVTPEHEGKGRRPHPKLNVPAPGSELAFPMNKERKQFVQPQEDMPLSHDQVVQEQDVGILISHKNVHEENFSKEKHECQENETGDKVLPVSDETDTSDSTLVLCEQSLESVPVNTSFGDGDMGNEEPENTLKVPFQFPTEGSEVGMAGDMTSIFSNKLKYTSMWNLIYQHVSSEALINENQGVYGLEEEVKGSDKSTYQGLNDKDSTLSGQIIDPREDDDNESPAGAKPELDQSAAIKLVKEAINAILNERPTYLQSTRDHHRSTEDASNSTPTSGTEDYSSEWSKSAEKHTYSAQEDQLHHVENTSLPLQQQVELMGPQRKMSKSLSKLKKAIATARFIKAMEKLAKSSPRKSQNPCLDTTSEEGRVYLRHRSMNGRKRDEEWMLDYALRQVMSKLPPDQQRRVALLVEAFETVHPEQKEKSFRCYPLKGEAASSIGLATPTNEIEKVQQKISLSVDHVPQDDGIQPSVRDASPDRIPQQDHDQQASTADDIIHQEGNETAKSDSTLKLSEDGSRFVSAVVTLDISSTGNEETGRAMEYTSLLPSNNPEVRTDGDMNTILFDKQNYTSMWNLIYQHVLSNEESTAGKKEVNEVDEEEQGDDGNTFQAINERDSTRRTQMTNAEVDEDKQSAAFDQSAAINLVKEAINAILQNHDQISYQQSRQDHGSAAETAREFCDTTALASTKDNLGETREEKQRMSKSQENLHIIENTSAPPRQQAEPNEEKKAQSMSKAFNKMKKAIVTAKFIKAMERLKRISPRKPRHLPSEAAFEKETVYLRHLSVNERRNDEEWMLDYALRMVISNLAPEKQRKVARLVEAFETVKPEQKGIGYRIKSERDPAFESESTTDTAQNLESNHDDSSSDNDDNLPMHDDRSDMQGEGKTLGQNEQDYSSTKFPNLRTELSCKIFNSDDINLHTDSQARSRDNGSPVSHPLKLLTARKEEIDAKCRHELFQHAMDAEQESEASIAKGMLCDKQSNTSMWHLIYQHVQSVSATEAGSKPSEILISEDQMKKGGASSEMIADADDDSDASSVASELTESDAIKLVREAINDILEAPQDLEKKMTSSNRTAATEEAQRADREEMPEKRLSRGYSKLRKLMICNKFIKAMEKTRKFYPQKQSGLALRSESEAEKAHLKTCAVGGKKGMDEWMLDNVLQKVIAGLAPVQQRKVALLVQAFEKVNPDPEEGAKGFYCTKTYYSATISSEGNTEEKEDTVSSQNSRLSGGLDLKQDRPTTSSSELATERVAQEAPKNRTPGLTKEYESSGGNYGPREIMDETSVSISTVLDTSKESTETREAKEPRVPLEERTNFGYKAGAAKLEVRTSMGEQSVENTEFSFKFVKKPPQPENLEDGWNFSTQTRSLEKSTSLWGLILQHVTTDMLEKTETPNTCEIDAVAQGHNTNTSKADDSSQLPSKVKSCRDMGVQTPASFDIQENEAIKLVEEAVEEMLLVQDQICETESMTSSTMSQQGDYSQNDGDLIESLPAATEIAEVATSPHADTATTLPRSYSTLSKVILCKRFVKAMDKMRKLKARRAQDVSQTPHLEEGTPSLRQITASDKKSVEEGMLDHALQKVIGNLAPAKKQRVAMLVQAFETVGSQPEPLNNWRGKASIS